MAVDGRGWADRRVAGAEVEDGRNGTSVRLILPTSPLRLSQFLALLTSHQQPPIPRYAPQTKPKPRTRITDPKPRTQVEH